MPHIQDAKCRRAGRDTGANEPWAQDPKSLMQTVKSQFGIHFATFSP